MSCTSKTEISACQRALERKNKSPNALRTGPCVSRNRYSTSCIYLFIYLLTYFLDLRFLQRWLWRVLLWDVTPCSPVEVRWRFGGTYYLLHQGRRYAKQATNKTSDFCLLLARTLFNNTSTMKMKAVHSSETLLNIYVASHPRIHSYSLFSVYLTTIALAQTV
jgi:hypothetical protein